MKKKKFKKKIIFSILLILIYILSFCVTIKYYLSNDTQLLSIFLNNNNLIKNDSNKRFITKVISFMTNTDFNKPVSLIYDNYDIKDISSSEDNEEATSLPKNNYVKNPNPDNKVTNPIVYLYNTHQSEEYKASSNQEYNVKPTVMTASYILREMLNKNGIKTIVEENDVLEFLKANNWNYASSYKVTKLLLEDIKEKEPTLKYYIDLHRDSVDKNKSTININNKEYAKLLFIVGLENPNYKVNLEFTEKLNSMLNKYYPGLSRGIYKKKGPGVNGVYNQDFDPNTILIEIGGQDNRIDEVYNSCIAITEILTEYIKGDNIES